MIHELEPSDFSNVTHLFQGHKQYVPVFSVIDRNFPGRVFVDEKDSPDTALVWAVSRWAYIDGDPTNPWFNSSFAELIQDVIIPSSVQMGMNWFELYTPDSLEWMTAIETGLSSYKPEKHHETVFTFDEQEYLALRNAYTLPSGSRIERVETPILPQRARDAPFVAEEFKTRTSFGFRLIRDQKVISICRSNGLASGNEFMIDVETFDEKERSKGYATAVGRALLDYCLEHGYIPLWETTSDNIPSRKVARRLGFVEHESYPVYAIEF